MRCTHCAIRTALYALLTHAIFLGTADVKTRAQALEKPEAAKHLIAMINGRLGPEATSGAGIVFGYEGGTLYIATANHVVRKGPDTAEDLTVQLRMLPSEKLAAELMPQTVKGLDLAVLRVSGVKDPKVAMLPFRRLGDPTVLNRRDDVFMVGFPGGRPWRANVTADLFSERVDDVLFFESISISRGNSGGGLFNHRWELIGMVLAHEPPDGRALNIERILEQLRQWGFPVGLRYTVFSATKIAFVSNRADDSNGDVFIMNPDGTGQTRLSNGQTGWYWDRDARPVLGHRPVWSPDGKSIAYATDFPGREGNTLGYGDIYRIGVDGTNFVNLTNHPARDGEPCWSLDGKKIAFLSDRSGGWEIYTVNADGAKLLAITRNTPANAIYEFPCTWSPDSKKIAFVLQPRDKSGYITSSEIHVVNADGTNQVRLTRNTKYDGQPSWSPDGKRIAFTSRDPSPGIFVINADGANRVRLTKPDAVYNPSHLSWSPDGTKILFSGEARAEGRSIWVLTSDGTQLTKLTVSGGNDPVWSPDGTMIAFWFGYGEYSTRREDICVMNADGTEPVCLTQNVRVEGGYSRDFLPAWSPFFR